MEKKQIIATIVKSNQSDNNVWAVAITGNQPSAHCKSAYQAMRFIFLLKKQTGLYINANSLNMLSAEIARAKAAKAEARTEEDTDTQSIDTPQDPEDAGSDGVKICEMSNHEINSAAVPQ